MSVVIYLSNDQIKVIVGTEKGGRATVERTYLAQAPEGSIINGQVTEEEVFTAFLRDFWDKNGLPKKQVKLVLGSAGMVTRMIQVPKMSHKKIMEYLPREFTAVERTKVPVYGYVKMSSEGSMYQILAAMADKSFLDSHVKRFKDMGIQIGTLAMETMAGIYMFQHLPYLKDKTCMVIVLDGMNLFNVLYVDGTYYQLSRSRIFSEKGTPSFGIECAKIVSSQQQFLNTRQVEGGITNVYVCGDFDEEDFEVCKDSILQMDENLQVELLYAEPGGVVQFQADSQDCGGFEKFVAPIGGLLLPENRGSLMYQYRHDPEQLLRRRKLAGYLAPSLIAVLALGAAAAVQTFIWFGRANEVDEQFDYMGNPAVMENVAEYDRLLAQNQMLEERMRVIEKTIDSLDSYPVYTSSVKQVIRECAAGLATAEVVSFERSLGMVSVEASSSSADSIHQFVERLESRTDLFDEIYYDGFDFDERSGLWKTSVKSYLAASDMTDEGAAQ